MAEYCNGLPPIALVPGLTECISENQPQSIGKLPKGYPETLLAENLQDAYQYTSGDFALDSEDWVLTSYAISGSGAPGESTVISTCNASQINPNGDGTYYTYYNTVQNLQGGRGEDINYAWIVYPLNCSDTSRGISKGPAALIIDDLSILPSPTVTPGTPPLRVLVNNPWHNVLRCSRNNIIYATQPDDPCPSGKWRLTFKDPGAFSKIYWECVEDDSSDQSHEPGPSASSGSSGVPNWCDYLQVYPELYRTGGLPINKHTFTVEEINAMDDLAVRVIYRNVSTTETYPGGHTVIFELMNYISDSDPVLSHVEIPGSASNQVTFGMHALGPNAKRVAGSTPISIVAVPCPSDSEGQAGGAHRIDLRTFIPACDGKGTAETISIVCNESANICDNLEVGIEIVDDDNDPIPSMSVDKFLDYEFEDIRVRLTFAWSGTDPLPAGYFLQLNLATSHTEGAHPNVRDLMFDYNRYQVDVDIPTLQPNQTATSDVPLHVVDAVSCKNNTELPCAERIEYSDTTLTAYYSFPANYDCGLKGSYSFTLTCEDDEAPPAPPTYTADITFIDKDTGNAVSYYNNDNCEPGISQGVYLQVIFTSTAPVYFCDDDNKATLTLTGDSCYGTFIKQGSNVKTTQITLPDITTEVSEGLYTANATLSYDVLMKLHENKFSGTLTADIPDLPSGGSVIEAELTIEGDNCASSASGESSYEVVLEWLNYYTGETITNIDNACKPGAWEDVMLAITFISQEPFYNGGNDKVTIGVSGINATFGSQGRTFPLTIDVPDITSEVVGANYYFARVSLFGVVNGDPSQNKACASITASCAGAGATLFINKGCPGCENGPGSETSSEQPDDPAECPYVVAGQGSDIHVGFSGGKCTLNLKIVGDDYIKVTPSGDGTITLSLNTAMFTTCDEEEEEAKEDGEAGQEEL